MLVYRVFPHLETAEPGHPLYEHRPQRGGRADHPDYYVWYVAREAEAACGEAFGNLSLWTDSMFDFPAVPGARKALGVYELPDDLRICDLDEPHRLVELGLRPTQVVIRNLAITSRVGAPHLVPTLPSRGRSEMAGGLVVVIPPPDLDGVGQLGTAPARSDRAPGPQPRCGRRGRKEPQPAALAARV